MSQGSFFALKMDSKWVPNRIIDAEGVRKPLDRHLGGYHSALRGILGALGRILSAIRSPKEAMRNFPEAVAPEGPEAQMAGGAEI